MIDYCFKPCEIKYNGQSTSSLERCSEVRETEHSCDFYDKTTIKDKIGSFFGRLFYSIKMKLLDVKVLFKYNLYGRIRYGFNLTDVWSLDSSMTKFIYPRLKYFVEKGTQGYPGVLCDTEFIKENKIEYLVGDEESDTWDNILKAMLAGFKIMHSDTYMNDMTDIDEVNEALRLFAIFYQNLWD